MNRPLIEPSSDHINIDAELVAATDRVRNSNNRWRPHAGFQRLEISPKAPSCGVDRVRFDRLGTYEVDPDAPFALIVGVVELGDLVDLAAIDFEGRRVATRLGIGEALGLDVIRWRRSDQRKLCLFASPWAWLRNPLAGAFFIRFDNASATLCDLPKIRCQTPALRERVRRAFVPRMPRLEVPTGSARHAT